MDWFPPVALIGLYREAGDAPQSWQLALAEALSAALTGCEGVAVQRRAGRRTVAEVLVGEVAPEMVVREGDMRFLVRPLANQNVGLFLDMAPLRARLAANLDGANVLNLFAYTGSLGVAAISGGARHVVHNDMSKTALTWARRNHEQNGHDLRQVRFLPHNVFKSWWKIRQLGPYDVVIIDPPTNQRGSFVVEKQYGQVLKRLPDMMVEGGTVYACLNSPFHAEHFLPELMARWCPQARLVSRLDNSPDFPDAQQDRALKVFEFRMR